MGEALRQVWSPKVWLRQVWLMPPLQVHPPARAGTAGSPRSGKCIVAGMLKRPKLTGRTAAARLQDVVADGGASRIGSDALAARSAGNSVSLCRCPFDHPLLVRATVAVVLSRQRAVASLSSGEVEAFACGNGLHGSGRRGRKSGRQRLARAGKSDAEIRASAGGMRQLLHDHRTVLVLRTIGQALSEVGKPPFGRRAHDRQPGVGQGDHRQSSPARTRPQSWNGPRRAWAELRGRGFRLDGLGWHQPECGTVASVGIGYF